MQVEAVIPVLVRDEDGVDLLVGQIALQVRRGHAEVEDQVVPAVRTRNPLAAPPGAGQAPDAPRTVSSIASSYWDRCCSGMAPSPRWRLLEVRMSTAAPFTLVRHGRPGSGLLSRLP
jgi:hypothetical protein